MPTLRGQPPTREQLSSAYGFVAPEAFARLMSAVHGWAVAQAGRTSRSPYDALDDIADLLGWFPAGPVLDALVVGESCRRGGWYTTTPPELMRFGDVGVDGAMNGYVVHAPELRSPEYPPVRYCAMDSEGVSKVGYDTMDGVRRMLANSWKFLRDPEFDHGGAEADPGPFAEFAEAVGVEWSAESDLDELWSEPASPAAIPDGWAWVRTRDGVGVLAPRHAFRDEGRGLAMRLYGLPAPPPEDEIEIAEKDLSDGFAASALYRLREVWWDESTHDPTVMPISRPMAAAYEALNRPLLARLTIERARYVSEMHKRMA